MVECKRTIMFLEKPQANTIISQCAILQITLIKPNVQIEDISVKPENPKFKITDKDGNLLGFALGVL